MNGFRERCSPDEQNFTLRRDNGGGWQPRIAVPNRFRLLEKVRGPDDAWTLQ